MMPTKQVRTHQRGLQFVKSTAYVIVFFSPTGATLKKLQRTSSTPKQVKDAANKTHQQNKV